MCFTTPGRAEYSARHSGVGANGLYTCVGNKGGKRGRAACRGGRRGGSDVRRRRGLDALSRRR